MSHIGHISLRILAESCVRIPGGNFYPRIGIEIDEDDDDDDEEEEEGEEKKEETGGYKRQTTRA